jgi:hypothetical protein|tara:strand:+ start:1205 stop:3202 length:1998 start_codon:yes stop_codon:yes gene_type:complete
LHVDAGERIARGSDRTLDLVVGALAIWTVVFHLARLVGLTRDPAFGLWVLATVVLAVLLARSTGGWASVGGHGSAGRIPPTPVVLGLATAAVLAFVQVDGLWWPLAWLALVGVLGAAAYSVRDGGSTPATTVRAALHRTSRTAAVSVLVLAGLAALLALVMVRPDLDDVFVVNRSAWVAANDTVFPDRDTIFSDDVLPVERPAALSTSVEALLGSAAAAGRVSAVALTHLGFGPLIAALAVLATWRLLRGLGARSAAAATWAGTLFLMLDGAVHGSFGNFFAGRSWQGKAAFLLLVVPTLWHHGAAYGRTGLRRHLLALAAGVVAGLGLTSSSVLVAPPVVLAAVAATALDAGEPRRIARSVAAAAPALLAGCYALFAAPQRLGDAVAVLGFLDVRRFLDSGTEPIAMIRMVFGEGPAALVALVAALTAWAVVGSRGSRMLLLAGPVVVFGAFLAPGVLDVLDAAGEADAVAWRTLWVLPLPAMVGLVVTAGRPGVRAAPAVSAAVVLVFLLLVGTPITSSANRGTEMVWPPVVDLPRPEVESARTLIYMAPVGGTVAGPADVDFAVSVLGVDVRAVNPRASYLRGRHAGRDFNALDRLTLTHALEHGYAEWGPEATARALDVLAPDVVCLRKGRGHEVVDVLAAGGYVTAGVDDTCRFFIRSTG